MLLDEFVKYEDEFQQKFDDETIEYEPIKVLYVTILRSRLEADLKMTDKVKVKVTCPELLDFNSYVTKLSLNSEVNETFKFVITEEVDLREEFPCKVMVICKDGVCTNEVSVDISKFTTVCATFRTLRLQKKDKHQDFQIDVEFKFAAIEKPDFRLGVGLSQGEKQFRKKRIPTVFENLKKIFSPQESPQTVKETPIISLCTSGGGFRALVGTMGCVEALEDAGIIDCMSYITGLSGSAWYISSAYGRHSFAADQRNDLHSSLGNSMKSNLYRKLVDPWHYRDYWKYIKMNKSKYSQPSSLVDFAGYTLGLALLGEQNLHRKLSDVREYIEEASLPYPLFVSLHVKNTILSSSFHAYMECSPYEIAFPCFGINMSPEDLGSMWNSGVLVRRCPEFPLHFHQGVTGAAMAMLLQATPGFGEVDEHFLKYMDTLRKRRKSSAPMTPINLPESPKEDEGLEFSSDLSSDSEDFSDALSDLHLGSVGRLATPERSPPLTPLEMYKDALEGEKGDEEGAGTPPKSIMSRAFTFVTSAPSRLFGTAEQGHTLAELVRAGLAWSFLRKTSMKVDRDGLIGRTGKIFNFTMNLSNLRNFKLNPFGVPDYTDTAKQELISYMKRGSKQLMRGMSVDRKVISLVDAACYNNVAVDIPLRPQRGCNVLIVCDFSEWRTDDQFQPVTMVSAAAGAWKEGLKFPNFNFKEILRGPPKECFVLEEEGDLECPIVLWFTLCNKKFRKVKGYKPRAEAFKNEKNFNDFSVYGPNSVYGTMNLCYQERDFERLRELMYFNVSSNIHVIKSAIKRATERKRKFLESKEKVL